MIFAHGYGSEKDGMPKRERLTRRERDVLHWVAQGLSNRDVGERLAIAEHTVEAHLKSIFNKLDVHNRAAATKYYWTVLKPEESAQN
jgi:DNA-binding CsgD family transcriptional regulator